MATLVTRAESLCTERALITAYSLQVVIVIDALKVGVSKVDTAHHTRLLRVKRVLLAMANI